MIIPKIVCDAPYDLDHVVHTFEHAGGQLVFCVRQHKPFPGTDRYSPNVMECIDVVVSIA